MTYTIDQENNITSHPGTVPASAADLQQFTTQKDLAKLAAEWPISRLVEIWNSFAGVAPFDDLKPIKKFTNRQIAVARIYKAVERLSATAAQPAPDVAPVPDSSKDAPTPRKRRDTAPPAAKKARPASVHAGLVYEREYKGKKYVLRSLEKDGTVVFKLRGGEAYSSLTAAAKAVTSYPSISGVAFWGEGKKESSK
ncbi:MAG TPA: hypothetical protein VME17_15445 [Bryobacteraceae bacterium]|nr:hypothetical protein [Bryobacteraceae bacterium]